MPFRPFTMERRQSTYENRVDYNLSESGVDPVTFRELLELHGRDTITDAKLGYGQSNGSDDLRARIAALYERAHIDGIVVMNGSAEANFAAMWHLVRPGDEVAILVPTYMQTHGLAENFGAHVVEIPLREELGWQPERGWRDGLEETVAWYEQNRSWWEPLKARAPVEETAWQS